jgi:pyruvate ferredoxin oxidoreductase gamma subunit
MCDMVCPDLCLVWSTELDAEGKPTVRLDGVDYQYCKGCMRCVETCATEAMMKQPETPGLADRLRVPLYPDLNAASGGKHAN